MTSCTAFGSSIAEENLYCGAGFVGGAAAGIWTAGHCVPVVVVFGMFLPFWPLPIFLQISSCRLAVANATASKRSSSSSSRCKASIV